MTIKNIFCGVLMAAVLFGNVITAGELKIESSGHMAIKNASGAKTGKYLIKFDFEKIPDNVVIDMAYIRMIVDIDSTISTPLTLIAYPVTEFWSASEIRSAGAEIKHTDILSEFGITSGKGPQEIELIVTDFIQAWVSGELANNGIVIMGFENSESSLDIYDKKPGVKAELTVLYSLATSDKE